MCRSISPRSPARARQRFCLVKYLAIGLLPASGAMAEEFSWIGGSGTWNVPSNWSPTGSPGNADMALLVQSGPTDQTVIYRRSSPVPTLESVRIDGLGGGRMVLEQEQDQLVTQNLHIGFNGAGIFTQSGGSNNVGWQLLVGGEPQGAAAGAGTYSLSGDAVLTAQQVFIGGSGPGTFHQSGGTATMSGMHINFSGNGGGAVYRQTNGLLNLLNSMHVGSSTESVGIYQLEGGTLNSTYSTLIGNGGHGQFVQTGGLHVTPHIGVGNVATPGGGSYTLSGGTLSITDSFMIVSNNARFTMQGGSLIPRPGGTPIDVTNSGTFVYSGGTASIGRFSTHQITGSGTLQIGGGSSLAVNWLYQSFVSIDPDARLTIGGAGTFGAHQTRILSISPGATLDLTDSALIVDYSGGSPLAIIRSHITDGYASGSWTGSGITSSSAAAEPDHALSFAQSAAIFSSFPAIFAGRAVDSTAVLVRYTRWGDADLNGLINLSDFNRLAANFGATGAAWSMGDFNYDGVVNLIDFNRLAANFGLSAGPDGPTAEDWAALASVVPEPQACFTLAAAMFALSRGRNRDHRTSRH